MKELIYTEHVDKNILKYILDHHETYDLGSIYIDGNKTTNGVYTLLCKYYTSLNENGELAVRYIQSKSKKFGRYWPVSIGITGICKKVRHAIAKEFNIDIDIVNCHPILLEQICSRYNIDCPKLQYYNLHRNKLVEHNANLKQRVLEVINGSLSRDDDDKFIDKLYVECSVIRQALKPHYQKIWKYIEKNTNTNTDGVFIANVLQDEENNCLMTMVETMTNKFNFIPITSLAYDGFTIQRSEECIELLPTILQTLEHDIMNETGFSVKLKVKDMDEGYDIGEMDDLCNCVYSHGHMKRVLEIIQLNCNTETINTVARHLYSCSSGSCYTEFVNVLKVDVHEQPDIKEDLYKSIMKICLLVPDVEGLDLLCIESIVKHCDGKLNTSVSRKSNQQFQSCYDVYDFLEHLRVHVYNNYELLVEDVAETLHLYLRPVLFPSCYLVNKGNDQVDIEKMINVNCRYKSINSHTKEIRVHKISLSGLLNNEQDRFQPLKQFIFHPNQPSSDRVYNTYTGMKAHLVDEVNMDLIQPILTHIKTCWANDNDVIYEYILTWLQHAFKFPHIKTGVVLLLFGLEGTGKNILIDNLIIPYIYGNHVSAVSHGLTPITQRFNSICMNKLFICCNEVSNDGGFHATFEKLKALITDPTMTIERKGIDIFESYNNFINFIFTTNNLDSVKLGQSDRRYCCIETSDRYKGNFQYFETLVGFCNQEAANHLYTYLYHLKLNMNIRRIPETQLKKDMSIHATNSCELFINSLDEVLCGYGTNDFYDGRRISSAHLYFIYKEWCSSNNEKVKSNKEFVRSMNRKGYEKKVVKINGHRVNGFEVET